MSADPKFSTTLSPSTVAFVEQVKTDAALAF